MIKRGPSLVTWVGRIDRFRVSKVQDYLANIKYRCRHSLILIFTFYNYTDHFTSEMARVKHLPWLSNMCTQWSRIPFTLLKMKTMYMLNGITNSHRSTSHPKNGNRKPKFPRSDIHPKGKAYKANKPDC